EHDVATCRDLVADQQLDQRRLARARRTDEEDEIALGDDQVHLPERDLAIGVLLGDVVQHQDRAVGDGLVAAAFEDPAARRARRRWCWGDGHGRLRGRESVTTGRRHGLVFVSTPSAGTAAGTTSARGYHRPPGWANVTAGPPGPGRWSGPEASGAAREGLEQSGRDRQVARQVDHGAIPA